ncbi:heavy-metal-associated domain-containing protein [Streptomyces erythrochromogenes]|uniref:heavy-metal-associated domain-containing protein n=1 Tax=Streptomyces erythrochromogenes TaxID=285574 RepID=UPI00225B8296|nr:cation transporter [Streptomyces erythrochromogenes]MCX5582936.1 cation transporter [Streptomyces erythrochromogenes]
MNLFGRKNKAAAEAETGARVVLLVEGMHCGSCGLLIDDELEELPGVRSAATDARTGRSVVLLEDGADVETAVLIAAVEGAGDYTARLAD